MISIALKAVRGFFNFDFKKIMAIRGVVREGGYWGF